MLLFLIILIIETRSLVGFFPSQQAVVLAAPSTNTVETTITGGHAGIGSALQDPGVTLQDLTLTNSLTVLGNTLFGKTSIAGGLTVDGSLSLGAQGLQSLGDTLYLEQNKMGPIDFMNGALRIDTNGSVTASGNFTVQGVLGATTITPNALDLTIDLTQVGSNSASFGSLLVKGSTLVSGDITASGTGRFNRITSPILETSKLLFTSTGESNSLGMGTIPAGFTGMKILNNSLTPNSRVFVTPITVTTLPISVTDVIPTTTSLGGSFTVETSAPVPHDLDFSWFIVN